MNKLNEQYFKTRRNHKRNYKKRKRLTWKRKLLNIIITLIGLYFVKIGYNYLNNKYEENKRKDLLEKQSKKELENKKDTLYLHKNFQK